MFNEKHPVFLSMIAQLVLWHLKDMLMNAARYEGNLDKLQCILVIANLNRVILWKCYLTSFEIGRMYPIHGDTNGIGQSRQGEDSTHDILDIS